jgi:hypothetical protein
MQTKIQEFQTCKAQRIKNENVKSAIDSIKEFAFFSIENRGGNTVFGAVDKEGQRHEVTYCDMVEGNLQDVFTAFKTALSQFSTAEGNLLNQLAIEAKNEIDEAANASTNN